MAVFDYGCDVVAEPLGVPVTIDDPIFKGMLPSGTGLAGGVFHNAVAILGVEQPPPKAGIGNPLGSREAENLFHVAAGESGLELGEFSSPEDGLDRVEQFAQAEVCSFHGGFVLVPNHCSARNGRMWNRKKDERAAFSFRVAPVGILEAGLRTVHDGENAVQDGLSIGARRYRAAAHVEIVGSDAGSSGIRAIRLTEAF